MATCFVVMAIGDQEYNGVRVTQQELRDKYDNLIKECIESALDDITVIRADDLSNTGSISSEIFKNLILADYVVVDLTYPNPNVFYELGLRHAVRNKTILIKESESKNNPFDITTLKYISYKDTSSGLKSLKNEFKKIFASLEENPNIVDNDFLKEALSMGVCFQKIKKDPKKEAQKRAMKAMLKNPQIIEAIENGEDSKIAELFGNMDGLDDLIDGLVDGEMLD
ncbi:TPA: hypothetical protein RQK26_003045 [Vibrio vulnificus]|nr:hypothetical protein [Vibrio vulnificus]